MIIEHEKDNIDSTLSLVYKFGIIILIALTALVLFSPSAQAVPITSSEYGIVSNVNTGVINIVDPITGTVVNSLYLNQKCYYATMNPAGTFLFAGGYDKNQLIVMSTQDFSTVKTIALPGKPLWISIDPQSTKAYVAVSTGSTDHVVVVSLTTFTILADIDTGRLGTTMMTFNPAGTQLWVVAGTTGMVDVISTTSLSVAQSININSQTAGNPATDIAFLADGSAAYTVGGPYICQISTSTYSVVTTWNCGKTLTGAVIGENSNYLYTEMAGGAGVNNLSRWNIGSATWTNITLPTAAVSVPTHLAITIEQNILLYPLQSNGTLAVVNVNNEFTLTNITRQSTSPCSVSVGAISGVTGYQYVTFTAKTAYDTLTVPGINVSVYTPGMNLMYASETDASGTATFLLNPVGYYNILFNQTPNINTWYNLTPSSLAYTVRIPFNQVIGLTSWADVALNNTTRQITYSMSTSYNATNGRGWMNITYTDPNPGNVQNVLFYLYQNATEWDGDDILINTTGDNAPPFAVSFRMQPASGNSYYVVIKPTYTNGNISTYTTGLGHTFPGPKVLAGVFPNDWYFWIAIGSVLFLYAAGTVMRKGLIAAIGAVAGYIFVQWGWYSAVMPDALALAAIGFTFILAIVMTLIERERYT